MTGVDSPTATHRSLMVAQKRDQAGILKAGVVPIRVSFELVQ